IGAGGTITWERFACGLPGVVYSVAENQVEMARDLESAGMQTYAGNINDYNWIDLARHLEPLSDAENRWLLSQRLRAEVDGKGVERVIEEWGLGG
ncbi:MAG: UDP-2,4-diacetamido-2,4,6-trideoxy-beta-L-altropyranose hydrolase, partial [Pseudomonadota bacterium]